MAIDSLSALIYTSADTLASDNPTSAYRTQLREVFGTNLTPQDERELVGYLTEITTEVAMDAGNTAIRMAYNVMDRETSISSATSIDSGRPVVFTHDTAQYNDNGQLHTFRRMARYALIGNGYDLSGKSKQNPNAIDFVMPYTPQISPVVHIGRRMIVGQMIENYRRPELLIPGIDDVLEKFMPKEDDLPITQRVARTPRTMTVLTLAHKDGVNNDLYDIALDYASTREADMARRMNMPVEEVLASDIPLNTGSLRIPTDPQQKLF